MAVARPFCAITYALSGESDVSTRIAPPYDVISPEQREEFLSRDPRNVVALELPGGSSDPTVPGNRYETASRTWSDWRKSGTLTEDVSEAVYVLEQSLMHEGKSTTCRAFFAAIRLEPFSSRVILPHERTLPKAREDRFRLLQSCRANFSPVFGLFSDPERISDALFEVAMSGPPIMTGVDPDGVTNTVWACRDRRHSSAFSELLADRRVFIADGHHRYEVALAYRDGRRAEAADAGLAEEEPAYDYVMMALVNMDDPDLMVLPTHRIADAPPDFDPEAFVASLAGLFEVTDPGAAAARALETSPRPAFLVYVRGLEGPRLVSLKPGVELSEAMPQERSLRWRSLDASVLQELVLRPLLGIDPEKPASLERLSFEKDAAKAAAAVAAHDVAFVLKPTPIEQMREVALAGETMPQKTTYFYPKVPSGLLFRSVE